MGKIKWASIAVLAALFLTACSFESWGSVNQSQDLTAQAGQVIGQTFKADYDGLMGIAFFPAEAVESGRESGISLFLLPDETPVRAASQSAGLDAVYTFEPVADSAMQSYRVDLSPVESDRSYLGGPADVYLDGSAVVGGRAVDRQLSFRLVYSLPLMAKGILTELLAVAGLAVIAFLLFVLPGYAILEKAWPAWSDFDRLSRIALAAGAGFAVYPVVFLWSHFIGLNFGAAYAWFPIAAALAYFVSTRRARAFRDLRGLTGRVFRSDFPFEIAAAAVIVLLILTRYWAVRDLAGPLWGDSVQHAMITQLILDRAGLFSDWAPYTELTSFNYHFGFHAAAATLGWLVKVPSWTAVLWMGQVLNVLAVLVLYPLAARISGSRWGGLLAVLSAGLVIDQPMFYTNWGRYTQLAGQVLLPVLMVMAADYFKQPGLRGPWRFGAVFGVTAAALALTHYRVMVLAAIFVLLVFLARVRRDKPAALIRSAALVGGIALLAFLPWLLEIVGGRVLEVFQQQITPKTQAETTIVKNLNIIGDLDLYAPYWFWSLSAAAGIWALLRRRNETIRIALWAFLVVVAANPDWIGLPGVGSVSNFTVFIAAYIPLSVVTSSGLVDLGGRVFRFVRHPGKMIYLQAGLAAAVIFAAVIGAGQRIRDISAVRFGMLSEPDLRAASWIAGHTPPESVFAVNSFTAWNDTAVVGSDGGWWLPLTAGRRITVPPLSYLLEKEPYPGYREQVMALAVNTFGGDLTGPVAMELLAARGVDYVYIGQQHGRVNWGGPVIEPETLLAADAFELVYQADRVWIFRINP